MLFEKIAYPDDFPINIRVASVQNYPLHYHQDVEFVYVLKGEIKLKNGYCSYLLKEGDIFTNSGHEVHGLSSTGKDNVVAIIQVSNWFFTQYFPTLHKACFRTYVNKDLYLQLDRLRRMLLQILMDYYKKSFHYKNQCTDMMIEVIKYMNETFNLFAFEDKVVVNFKNNNPIIVERISRIINYVYENHSSKITLEDLARREHLSTYYLSHLIKDYMGISFQEFLCFARVEMSEIPLLETGKKISGVARDAGFSTTAYYEKYFRKWFGRSPLQHREQFQPQILSPYNQEKAHNLTGSETISLIKRRISVMDSQNSNPSTMNHLQLEVQVGPENSPILRYRHGLAITVTLEDFKVMGDRLFAVLSDMGPSVVNLAPSASDGPEELQELQNALRLRGFSVENGFCSRLESTPAFGCDTIAAFFHIFKEYFLSKDVTVPCRLRDPGDPQVLLKGFPACFTSGLLPKPSYYAYQLLRAMHGKLLHWSKYYSVTEAEIKGKPAYILLGFNYNDEIERLCSRSASLHETSDILNDFIDEINLNFNLTLPRGQYSVLEYAFTSENNIFAYMAQLGFPDKNVLTGDWTQFLSTQPCVHCRTESVADKLTVSFNMRGAAAQVAVVLPLQ